jgi:hypothetical protein
MMFDQTDGRGEPFIRRAVRIRRWLWLTERYDFDRH